MKKTPLLIGIAAAVLLTLSLTSCKKDANPSVTTLSHQQTADVINNNGRLQFKDSEALSKTIQSLITKTSEDLNKWDKELHFRSLKNDTAAIEKFSSFGFPDFYESILNNKGEYMIGDTIVYFDHGYKYLIPNKDETLLNKIKYNQANAALKFVAGSSVLYSSSSTDNSDKTLGPAKNTGINLSTVLNNNYKDARYQYQFHKDGDPNSVRKIVFELQNYYEQNSFAYVCYFHTRIKQEYLAGNEAGNWKPAGEVMEKSFSNLNFDVAFINTGNGTTTHITGSGRNASQTDGNDLDVVLTTFQASQSAVTASVSGNYHAKVIPAGNSAGHYDLTPASW